MSEVSQLEAQRDHLKTLVKRRNLALKLEKNPEFQDLILNTFCVTECARYAQLSADPALSPEDRTNSLAVAQAAGHLRRYLSVTVRMGNQAENDLLEIDQAIVEAAQEEEA